VSGSGLCLGHLMNRLSDDKTRRGDRPHAVSRQRVRSQVHAIGTAGQRDVGTIVDEDSRAGSASHCDQLGDQGAQLVRRQIAFTNLYDVDPSADGEGRLRAKTIPHVGCATAGTQPLPIGDEVQDQGSSLSAVLP
jgi:hypothetical protein